MRQIQRRHLQGSRWTARTPVAEGVHERHFEVVSSSRAGIVVMRAILTSMHYAISIAALRDEAAWTPGWISD